MSDFPISIRIILTLCFLGLLMLASLFPGRPSPGETALGSLVSKTPVHLQKAMHVFLYAVLALLLAWTLDDMQTKSVRLPICFGIAVAFGALMEWCQTRVPGRFGTQIDVLLNSAGAALGLLVAVYLL